MQRYIKVHKTVPTILRAVLRARVVFWVSAVDTLVKSVAAARLLGLT